MRGAKGRNAEEQLEPLIHVVRGQRVILDADLARLYGVTTKALNQAVKRNVDRFPVDFAFQLSAADLVNLRSHSVISKENLDENQGDKIEVVTNCDHLPKIQKVRAQPLGFYGAWRPHGRKCAPQRARSSNEYLRYPRVRAVTGTRRS